MSPLISFYIDHRSLPIFPFLPKSDGFGLSGILSLPEMSSGMEILDLVLYKAERRRWQKEGCGGG
jgi:hypothetical protein